MRDVQTENGIVGDCWRAVRKDLKSIVESKGGEIKTCGVRFWDRPICLDEDTGQWAERGMQSKPSRWLLACADDESSLEFMDRMAYFSLRNEALSFVVRAVPTWYDSDKGVFDFTENTEWVVVFVASSLTPRGSSSATAHASRLGEGILTITTDDREFEVPLACIGLIKPEDQLGLPKVRDVDSKLESLLSEAANCYLLNDSQERETFLRHVDQLDVGGDTDDVADEDTWITDQDLRTVETLFKDGQSSLMLWGDDYSTITATIEHLARVSSYEFSHYEALPTWDEYSLNRLIDQENLENKIVCIHGAERLSPELVLPPVLPRRSHVSLKSSGGHEITVAEQKPRCWIFTGHRLCGDQIRDWSRASQYFLRWFRCEAAVSAIDSVKRIYQEEGVQISASNWFDNLFVIMWDELKAHLPVAPELMAVIIRSCLRQDPSGTWDLDSSPIQKGILVEQMEGVLSPVIASLSGDMQKSCVNSLVSTLEIPQAQAQRLLFLARSF